VKDASCPIMNPRGKRKVKRRIEKMKGYKWYAFSTALVTNPHSHTYTPIEKR